MRPVRIAALTLAAALLPAPAQASFPGGNGKLAVLAEGCQNQTFVRAMTPSGRSLGTLVPCAPGSDGEPGPNVYGAEWSPDGRRLAFAEGDQLFSVAPDGTDRRPMPVAIRPEFEIAAVSFAPDGRHVVFVRDGSLYTSSTDGTETRLFRRQVPCPGHDGICLSYEDPRWSPDGRRIAFEATGKHGGVTTGLWIADASTGTRLRRVAKGGYWGAFNADWSPDGRRLVFNTDYQQDEVKGGASGGNIYTARTDGRGKPRRIVHRHRIADTDPTWSPDGRSIMWVALRFGGGDVSFRVKPSIWRMRLRGGHPRLVERLPEPYVEEGEYASPTLAWQPLPR